MRQSRYLLVLLVVGVLMISGLGLSSLEARSRNAPIRLLNGTFNPGRGEQPDVQPGLAAAARVEGRSGYYIVQFAGPVEQSWKDQVLLAGAELLDYVPDFAFKVRMTPAAARRVVQHDAVVWVGDYHPAYSLSPDLRAVGDNLYTLQVERGANAAAARGMLEAQGIQIVSQEGRFLVVLANGAQLNAMARVEDVAWIQNFSFKQRHNEYGAGAISGAAAAHANGYDGSGQIVGTSDSGFGTGNSSNAHPDVPASRITSIYSWSAANSANCYNVIPDGAQDVDGHGTHTALSILGDGGPSGEGRGSAPGANLVFQAVDEYIDFIGLCALQNSDGYYLIGIPTNIQDLFTQAYNDGARVHSNSWGDPSAFGVYDTDAAGVDTFVWNNPDMVITFSTGNGGVDANSNGVVDDGSITDPATAKNSISVGASENDRAGNWDCDSGLSYTSCGAQSGQNSIFTYGAAWPSDFPVAPLAGDPSAGNAEQMAAFSATGPVNDGRLKPDVVAPGTWVLSGYSTMYQQEYDASANPVNGAWQYDGWGFPYSSDYKYSGGTSMSNPIVAGGAAVVRDFYDTLFTHNASAALVKATIINSAVDMLDENNDGANDNDFPIPNTHEGWGRMNLGNATDNSHQWVDNTTGVNTSGSASYQYSVTGNSLKISLVWSDYPSTAAASTNLVNDLDLIVTAPGGAQYKGNVFSGGWSQIGGSADRINNVENVYIASATAGTWTVEINGFNVPQGPQPFALVVDGTFGTPATNTPGPTATNTPVPSNTPLPTNTPLAGTLHVQSVNVVTVHQNGPWYHGEATITIVDGSNNPVSGATVSGDFSGPNSSSESGVTNGLGQITFSSERQKNGSGWAFCVSNVVNGSDNWIPTGGDCPSATATPQPPTATPGGPTNTPAPPTATSTPSSVTDVHLENAVPSTASAPRNRWIATVTYTVFDAGGNGVAGVTVNVSYSNGANGGGNCVTNGNGVCSVTKNNLKSNVGSVTFTVTSLTGTNINYVPGANQVSNVTVVAKP